MSPPRLGVAQDVAAVLRKELGSPASQQRADRKAALCQERDEPELLVRQFSVAEIAAKNVARFIEEVTPIPMAEDFGHLVHQRRGDIDGDGRTNRIAEVDDAGQELRDWQDQRPGSTY